MLFNVFMTRLTYISLAAVWAIGLNISVTYAEDDVTDVAAAQINPKYTHYKENFSVKRLFASRCSWCHQGYGLKEADGPRLSGTDKSKEYIIEQIAYGKSPMPGFRKQLKPWQIEALADYIKALPDVAL
ncbi:cytochrome c [Burkholderiales bacterium]|nr:cytochrome c [Burkholderiales bacterium]